MRIFRRERPALAATAVAASLFVCSIPSSHAQLTPRDYAVEVTATASSSPAEIRLHWPASAHATSYRISRKLKGETAWTELGAVVGRANSFLDRDVRNGTAYEYQVIKETSAGYTGYGYITAGIELPLIEHRGTLLLLVESSIAPPLAAELKRLEWDLAGDGWIVIRRDVPATESVPNVKSIIREQYAATSGALNAVFLFGHLPVPYSGDISPDFHPWHRGAWPADVYYADVDGSWTDVTVTSTGAERSTNHNIPGDGKFDQSEPPSAIELQVGRVDLSLLTSFLNKSPARSEVDLLRNYLHKDHHFRHGRIPVEQRALIFDANGLTREEPGAAFAWRSFPLFVGGNIETVGPLEYIPAARSKTYLFSSVLSGGGYTWSDWVGYSDVFALSDIKVVFTFFLGSGFGDWNMESGFLRAALGANGAVLTSAFGGQPPWICHPMAMGETIGFVTQITQENRSGGVYPPFGGGAGQVHVALMGDPTLRAHPILPPERLNATLLGSTLALSWDPSPARGLRGCLVYKRNPLTLKFERLTPEPIQAQSFSFNAHTPGNQYLLKAVALTQTHAGSYWNASVGLFFPDPLANAQPGRVPSEPRELVVAAATPSSISLKWNVTSANHEGFRVERAGALGDYQAIAVLGPAANQFVDSDLPGIGGFRYRVAAFNQKGSSAYSNEAFGSNSNSEGEFIGLDKQTGGNWLGIYGKDGYEVFGLPPKVPPTVSITISNLILFGFPPDDQDHRHLRIPDSASRIALARVSHGPSLYDINIADDRLHQLALYAIDPDRAGRPIQVDLIDFVSNRILDSRTVEDHREGVYFIYAVRGRVLLRITPESVYVPAFTFGLFFDQLSVAPVTVSPPPGVFNGKTQISLSTITPSSTIRYTLDGSEPTVDSPPYTSPFWLYATTTVRARAFRQGFLESPELVADYFNTVINRAAFLRWDESSRGNWVNAFGREGYALPHGQRALPNYVEMNFDGASEWTWTDSTSEDRALFTDPSGAARKASGWYAPDSFSLDLSVFDSKSHALALYFVDWDNLGREQSVELLGSSGQVLERFVLNDFSGGKYLVLNVQGQFRLRFTKVRGNNALLNGLFFDPAPPELNQPKPVPMEAPRFLSGDFIVRLSAQPGQRFCLDRTSNFDSWSCVATNMAIANFIEIKDVGAQQRSKSFYRVHFLP